MQSTKYVVDELPRPLQAHIKRDEQVFWAGQPAVQQAAMRKVINASGIGLFVGVLLAGLVVAFLLLLLPGEASDPLYVPIMLGIGAATVVGSVGSVVGTTVLGLWGSASRAFAITDHDFIWAWDKIVKRFELHNIYNIEVCYHFDGTGTITFLGTQAFDLYADSFPTYIAFDSIQDVDLVVAIARQVAQQAGYNEKEYSLGDRLDQIVGGTVGMLLSAVVITAVLIGLSMLIGKSFVIPESWESALGLFVALCEPRVLPLAIGTLFAAVFFFIWSDKTTLAARRSRKLHWLWILTAALKLASALVMMGAMGWIILITWS
jgi:hypothetical protein